MAEDDVAVGDTTLRVRSWGPDDGRPLLFWHSIAPWGPYELNEAGPLWAERDYRVIAPAAPGFDGSPALAPERYRPSALAALCSGLLDALAVPKAVFVGGSWGADVGLHVDAAHFEALVLLDAGFTDLATEWTLAAWQAHSRRVFEEHSAPSLEAWLAEWRGAEVWTDAYLDRELRSLRTDGTGGVEPDLDPDASGAAGYALQCEPGAGLEVAVPTLLVLASSRGDVTRFDADVRRATTGHDMLAEAPRETVALVADWLDAVRLGLD